MIFNSTNVHAIRSENISEDVHAVRPENVSENSNQKGELEISIKQGVRAVRPIDILRSKVGRKQIARIAAIKVSQHNY